MLLRHAATRLKHVDKPWSDLLFSPPSTFSSPSHSARARRCPTRAAKLSNNPTRRNYSEEHGTATGRDRPFQLMDCIELYIIRTIVTMCLHLVSLYSTSCALSGLKYYIQSIGERSPVCAMRLCYRHFVQFRRGHTVRHESSHYGPIRCRARESNLHSARPHRATSASGAQSRGGPTGPYRRGDRQHCSLSRVSTANLSVAMSARLARTLRPSLTPSDNKRFPFIPSALVLRALRSSLDSPRCAAVCAIEATDGVSQCVSARACSTCSRMSGTSCRSHPHPR